MEKIRDNKKVGVLRSDYTKIKDPLDFNQKIVDCIRIGSKCLLYKDPNISDAFYELGTKIQDALYKAIIKRKNMPNRRNYSSMLNCRTRGIKWMYSYSDKVEEIANDEANCTTRSEAATNILQANLKHKKLAQGRKGNPPTPEIKGKNITNGKVKVWLLNGKKYNPKKTNFVAIQAPSKDSEAADPEVTLNNGLLDIKLFEIAHVVFLSLDGKAKSMLFEGLINGVEYHIYAYAQNGKKQVSKLSKRIIVMG